jgi:hypothetical protein
MPTRTAAQRRAQAKVEYDAFLARCPSRQLLDRISDKWVALILAALGSDTPSCPAGWPESARRCSPRRSAPSSATA